MMNLICLMKHILFHTFRITSNLSSKNTKLWLKIYSLNFTPIKSKTGSFLKYKLELLSPETVKLLGSTEEDIDKDKDGEDVPRLESVVFNAL